MRRSVAEAVPAARPSATAAAISRYIRIASGHVYLGEILEPALCWMEVQHLFRQSPRVQVMHDEQPGSLINNDRMGSGQLPGLLRDIEGRLCAAQRLIRSRIAEMAPVEVHRRETVRAVVAEHGRGIDPAQADIHAIHAV